MLPLKISLATLSLLSLIIPFLIEPVSALYDIPELEKLRAYCFLHADRAAQGQNVVNDLIKSGLANSTFYDWSCSKIDQTLQSESQAESERLQAEQQAESQRQQDYANHCQHGNLTPPQYWECKDAGHEPPLFNLGNSDYLGGDAEICNFESTTDPLTPAERQVCLSTGHEPGKDTLGNDKDTKESDK